MGPKAPYAVLWNEMKRTMLVDGGLNAVAASAHRISFEELFSRPRETKASAPKEGPWRHPVKASTPYAPEDEDADLIAEPSRRASRVLSAAYEHPMGWERR